MAEREAEACLLSRGEQGQEESEGLHGSKCFRALPLWVRAALRRQKPEGGQAEEHRTSGA